MSATNIEWATHTVNWQSGCTRISPACEHCYAERMSRRLEAIGQDLYAGAATPAGRWTGALKWSREKMEAAFDELGAARKPRRVFVGSMTDLWHAEADPAMHSALAVALRGPWRERAPHVLMFLTKRPENLLAWQRRYFPEGLPAGVWVGCTVEDQRRADERIPVLLQVRASLRFLSMEPLLGPVALTRHANGATDPLTGLVWSDYYDGWVGQYPSPGIGWVIAGGESGHHARPSHPDWFRSLRDQCSAAGVPFFFKQWGEWGPTVEPWTGLDFGRHERLAVDGTRIHLMSTGGALLRRWGKASAGRLLNGIEHNAFPSP